MGDGLELLARFKTRRPNLPVLIHSYYDRRSYVAKSHAIEASGYLVKGLDDLALIDVIRRALNGESVWRSALTLVRQGKNK
jgi:DNA-binding NarL/FixJ family response regulator